MTLSAVAYKGKRKYRAFVNGNGILTVNIRLCFTPSAWVPIVAPVNGSFVTASKMVPFTVTF
ncbi:hypothetical protein [Mucilaginibacter antarcticus]|uniref:hypothetical protein n=1 Tax=Mucilaginibacter antarcticus TaxID=1855725 RepID=UPI003639E7DA